MAVGGKPGGIHPLALAKLWQSALGVVGFAAGEVIDGFDIGLQEPWKGNRSTARREGRLTSVAGVAVDPQAQRGAAGVGHLRGDRALPDQFVEPETVAIEFGVQRTRGGERLSCRADRLVGLLGVLDLAGVLARTGVDVLVAVKLAGLVARRVNRRLRQRGRVGPHIGDVAVLVELLGHAHGALGAEPELAAGLLLQGRRHERRVRAASVRLLLDRGHGQGGALQPGREGTGGGLIEHQHLVGFAQHPQRVEVPARRHPLTVDGDQPGAEPWRGGVRIRDAGVQLGQDVPVGRATEGHPLTLALNDDASRHGLHPAGRQAPAHLLPQHRADLVAVQPVQDAAGLLGVDEVGVQIAGIFGGGPDRRFGDLVKHHPPDRDFRFQGLQQMPGDGLALPVTVGGQIQLVDVFEQTLQFGNGGLLIRADHVEGFEVVVDVDAGAGPGLRLILRRHIGGVLRQVADVASGGLDNVIRAEVTGDFARLGGRLDDDEPTNIVAGSASAVVVSQLRPRSHSVVSGHPVPGQFRTPGPADANRPPR